MMSSSVTLIKLGVRNVNIQKHFHLERTKTQGITDVYYDDMPPLLAIFGKAEIPHSITDNYFPFPGLVGLF